LAQDRDVFKLYEVDFTTARIHEELLHILYKRTAQ